MLMHLHRWGISYNSVVSLDHPTEELHLYIYGPSCRHARNVEHCEPGTVPNPNHNVDLRQTTVPHSNNCSLIIRFLLWMPATPPAIRIIVCKSKAGIYRTTQYTPSIMALLTPLLADGFKSPLICWNNLAISVRPPNTRPAIG